MGIDLKQNKSPPDDGNGFFGLLDRSIVVHLQSSNTMQTSPGNQLIPASISRLPAPLEWMVDGINSLQVLLIFCTFSTPLLFWMSSPVFFLDFCWGPQCEETQCLLLKPLLSPNGINRPNIFFYSNANESNDMIHGHLGFTGSMVTITIPTSPDIGTNLF